MPQDYNKTLQLPQTDFPMRASLSKREPAMLEQWETERLYYKMIENNADKPIFCFHDGPPYANADIHLGTALNKVLKDFIVRYKNIAGFKVAYVPGWDTHGLPIELKAIKQVGLDVVHDPVKLRKHCAEFAMYHVKSQTEQFKRLGTLADYDNPYLTLRPAYEAKQIEIFGAMAKKGYIYKDLKSVYWCPECTTALAEAEIEYEDDPCDSVYVKFQITEDKNGVLARMGADLANTYAIIWTTTTWTLPANLAIALGPEFVYTIVKAGGEYYLMAKDLVEETMAAAEITEYEVLGTATGDELEYVQYKHPFLERTSPLILGDHVTLEAGTGCVHTAPGHGVEDFEVCAKFYPEVGVVVPVDDEGKMTAEAGDFIEGLPTGKANAVIQERLQQTGHLLALKALVHQYPHCWRCKEPILFRATNQWFCSVEDFKEETIAQLEQVQFIPEWGRGRMTNMVQDRDAWCISRQRIWGVPIPVFYCDACEEPIITDETIASVAEHFHKKGSDCWYTQDAATLLPQDFTCPKCGKGKTFTKETDIMDVWFDSGVSHAATLMGDWPDQTWPCDLYLEGTDQYRGWFQSSLLTSVAWKGVSPYRAVCTHGWVVDGEGKKMSKSLGNGVEPKEIIDRYGADILRLWVASSDYHADIRMSDKILKQLSDTYRKIRNTARYILGNLSDFDPNTDQVEDSQLLELDRWALAQLNLLLAKTKTAYDRFDFHVIYHAVQSFCTIDMSNFYLDVIKDRLYVEQSDSVLRRSAQTAIYRILRTLDLILAPILCFTAEEIWGYLPADQAYNPDSVMFNELPAVNTEADEAFAAKWDQLILIRDDVNKALELAREQKTIGKSLEAKVKLFCADKELYTLLQQELHQLPTIFITSQVEVHEGNEGAVAGVTSGLSVTIEPAEGQKCERCWMYTHTIGQNENHPTLCARCATVIES